MPDRLATRIALIATTMLASCSARGAAERCDVELQAAGPIAASAGSGRQLGDGMGIQVQSWYLRPGDLDRIARAGFSVVRWGIAWDAIETAPGVFDWREADRFVDALARSGLRSVVILGYGNHLYVGADGGATAKAVGELVEARPPTTPLARAAFARFAATAASRYRDRPITWEIWNEPDSATFWKPAPDPAAYARLTRETCAAMRAVAPRAAILGGVGAAMPNAVARSDNVYGAMMRVGAMDCLDGVSGHAYRMSGHYQEPDPESIDQDNTASRRYLYATLKMSAAKRFVVTEWGYPTTIVGADRQAAYLIRANLMNAATGVPLTIWYEWRDSRADTPDPEAHFGLATMTGGAKSDRALAILSEIAKTRLVRRLSSTCDDARLFQLDRGGEHLIVGWLRSDAAQDRSKLYVNGVARGTLSFFPALFRVPAR